MTALERLSRWLIDDVPGLLPEHLRQQRWFAGKSAAIDDVRVDDLLWVAENPEPVALAIVTLRLGAEGLEPARRDRYALLLAIREEVSDDPLLAAVPWEPGRKLVEASGGSSGVLALLRSVSGPGEHPSLVGGAVAYVDSNGALERTLSGSGLHAARLAQEQSNTSLRVGRAHVAKLFRRLQDGENPQLEVGRFLAGCSGFRATPPLDGALVYRRAGADTTLGVVERWMDNDGDGWSFVTGRLAALSGSESRLAELAADLFGLGSTTADLHLALASRPDVAAFAPEPMSPSDVEASSAASAAAAARTFALVEQHQNTWPEIARTLARELLDRRRQVFEAVRLAPLEAGESLHRIRVHGDYHLGQTLRVDRGFLVIDFEGEPLRPLAERRQKQCALKDVAGMLRSLDYAAAGVRGSSVTLPGTVLARLRRAFLEGYVGRALAAPASLLPPARLFDSWTRAFELEKALYEVEYEHEHRPSWLEIPLRGVLALSGAGG